MSQTILYLHNSVEISGGEKSLLGLWSVLDRQRYRPVAVLPSEGRLADAARSIGVGVYVLKVPSWRIGSWTVLWESGKVLAAIVKKESAVLIHSYTPRNNLLAAFVARGCGIRLVWQERNIPVGGEKDLSAWLRFVPDMIICNSQAVARRFGRSGKVRVILNGVDGTYFLPGADRLEAKRALGLATRKVVGVVSNLSPRKGLEIFLYVAAMIAREDPRVSFLVAGGEYGRESAGREMILKSLADKLGLSGRIVWMGFREDVRSCLSAMDVLCHPTEQEACSRAVLEAMACAIPVVACDDGGNPELIRNGETGILIRSGRIEEMAEAVRHLLRDENCCQRFGICARERIEREFTLKRNGEQTMEVYRKLCV